jgi:hypothetical protein
MRNLKATFNLIDGWTALYHSEMGEHLVGSVDMPHDERLIWHLGILGGARNKRILELGPCEAAHTKMLVDAGAREVIAVEGNGKNYLKCLIVKEAFQLTPAKLIYAEFCDYVARYTGEKFDFVSAAGVLYHQNNPAELIYNLAKITDRVIVWSQVAGDNVPSETIGSCAAAGQAYLGRINHNGNALVASPIWSGGLNPTSLWLYPEELRRCFREAGFSQLIERETPPTQFGNALLFVALK